MRTGLSSGEIEDRELKAKKREARRLNSIEKVRKKIPSEAKLFIPEITLSPFYPPGQKCEVKLGGKGSLRSQIQRAVAKDPLTLRDRQTARDKGWINW